MADKNGNAAEYFVNRHTSQPYADKPAYIEGDGAQRSLSYRQLAHESSKMQEIFQRHQIRSEDRVAMLMLDQIEFPVVFWGSLAAGVIPVAINTLLSTEVYATILNDCKARVLFVSAALLPAVESLLSDHAYIETVFVSGEHSSKYLSLAAELESATPDAPLTPVTVSGDECAFWLYSSGSTGQPKGVRHVHSSLQFTADTYGKQVLGIEQNDIVYSAAKFFFAYGLGNAMTFPLSVGATTVLLAGRPTPDSVLALINEHKPGIFCGVPTLYAALLAHIEAGKASCDVPLRCCISAGEALPEDIGRQWKKLTSCDILDGVGSTEMLHIFLSNHADDVVYGTSGVAVPGYELRLVDTEGNDVGTGEVGELLVNGASAASDYWNQRDKSRTTFEGEWTRTGDKYEIRPDGRYIYCGRTDDMFKVSGIWVSPFEVEQAIVSHPAVLEAAVVAARDDQDLEKPKAFVVLKQEVDTDAFTNELKEQVKNKIGKWKYPRWVEVVTELPKTATGKIQRFKLRS